MSPEAATRDRASLIEANIIHAFEVDTTRRNLRGSYGVLMRRRYERMLPLLSGRRVLDAGCGIGLFSSVCRGAGIEVTSIDLDTESLRLAWEFYSVEAQSASVYDTQLPDGSIEAVALFDVVEHLDLKPLFRELKRLGVGRALVYDSNVSNPILRWYRRRSGHEEHREYKMKEVVSAFSDEGYELADLNCENSLMLPLTGGLQRNPLPLIGGRPSLVDALDAITTAALRLLHLEQLLCFRYFAVFDRVR